MDTQPVHVVMPHKSIYQSRYQAGSGKAILLLFIGMVSILGLVFLLILFKAASIQLEEPLSPPGMAAARYSANEVVGDLGGMPVTIPSYFANFAEYEGDPGWGEKRKGPRPERNHQSKLVSFGFEVRFPDMAGLSGRELYKNRDGFNIHNTPWLNVKITTGAYFGDGFYLEVHLKRLIEKSVFQFEKQTLQPYGLDVYTPVGVDPNTRQAFKIHYDDQDVFVKYSPEGKVATLIRCSNVKHAAAPCEQSFSLPRPLKAWVDIQYRRGLLPEWQQIQTSVTALIMGFKVPEGRRMATEQSQTKTTNNAVTRNP